MALRTFTTLKLMGFMPESILDIGANKGDWTRNVRGIFPEANFLMVEANAKHNRTWQDMLVPPGSRVRGAFAVLDSQPKDVQWFMAGTGSTGDSIFREKSWHQFTAHTRRAETLDGLVARTPLEGAARNFGLVKLDVQSAELRLLAGGSRVLATAEVVAMEVPFAGQCNAGAPSFADYIRVMDEYGFAVFDMPEVRIPNNVVR